MHAIAIWMDGLVSADAMLKYSRAAFSTICRSARDRARGVNTLVVTGKQSDLSKKETCDIHALLRLRAGSVR